MTPQSNFMIFAAIRDGELAELRKLLATMVMAKAPAHADPNNKLVPFGQFGRLHFARFTIIEATADENNIKEFGASHRPWQPTLAFLGDCDGDRDSFLAELVEHAEKGLTEIFKFCVGYPDANSEGLLAWMKAHHVDSQANYINWIGRTVQQVREEATLHRRLSDHLQRVVDKIGRENARELRQELLAFVEMEKYKGNLTLTPPAPTPLCWKILNCLHKLGIPLILLLLAPLFIIFALLFFIRLRWLESTDSELYIRPTREHIQALSAQEDWDVTNQYNVFGYVKPGIFRRLTFEFILLITDYVARHIYNRGFLTRIRTIHFAHWTFVDNDRRIFFTSNYDGSHESYMDDFINKVSWGLNIVFSCGAGYPKTSWLIKEGAERELQFKAAQRRHQLPSEVWYKAYPGLTATDLMRNSRIRQGVEIRQSNEAEIREWLSLI
jgi:hypothetical protein